MEVVEEKKVEKKLVKCQKCGYEWWSRTRLLYTTCPNCQAKVRVK